MALKRRYMLIVALVVLLTLASIILVSAQFSYAQIVGEPRPQPSFSLLNPLGETTTLDEFFSKLIKALLYIAYPIVVLAVIYSGFLFLKAQGKPEELAKARSALLWTLVGALMVLGAQVIFNVIKGTVDEIEKSALISDRSSADS